MLTRRRLAQILPLLAAPALASPAVLRARETAPEPVHTLLLMGDLHSGYNWSAKLLAAIRHEVALTRGRVTIVVNGDVFEHNNAIARANTGAIDLALLRAFADIAPTYVTIGNHDSDLFDPRQFAADIAASGAHLLTDITDPRSGKLYGPAAAKLRAGKLTLGLAAIGTPVMAIYPKAYRASYAIPDPADYAKAQFPSLFAGTDLPIALVHAGFLADRRVLPSLKPPFVLHGAHDHLRFTEAFAPDALHLQSGAWSASFQVLQVFDTAHGPRVDARDVVLDAQSPADPALAAQLTHAQSLLSPADLAVIGHSPRAMPLDEAVLFLAAAIRRQTGVDIALLQHTTFGDGLPEGPVRAFDRDSFLRFDGAIAFGTLDGTTLRDTVLPRTNQRDGVTPYHRRTGDYLYATPLSPEPDRTYRAAITSYSISTADNRRELLGADLPGFVPDPSRKLSTAIAQALSL